MRRCTTMNGDELVELQTGQWVSPRHIAAVHQDDSGAAESAVIRLSNGLTLTVRLVPGDRVEDLVRALFPYE